VVAGQPFADPKTIRRNDPLFDFDKKIRASGFAYLGGADESGRGALAGPLAAAAVILPEDLYLEGLDDSKRLTPKKRETLYALIIKGAICWKVILIEPAEIDKKGLHVANLYALESAVIALDPAPDFVITDRYEAKQLNMPHLGVKKGDRVSATIAAASIVAKVTRDGIMREYAEQYPEYGLEQHKGYGTKSHFLAIRKHGPSPIHRRSFAGVV
jgi:ribonuclease HII